MMIARYLSRLFVLRALGVLAGLALLLQVLDLLDRASDVLARGGVADIGRYAALRLPSILGHLVPLSVLAGAILTFRRLAATLEVTALGAAGVGPWRLVAAMLPVTMLFAALQAGLTTGLAPYSERALATWWEARGRGPEPVELSRRLWFRNGPEVIAADAVSVDGAALAGLLVLRRDGTGALESLVEAARATHGAQGWLLEEVRVARPGEARTTRLPTLGWPEGPPPPAMAALAWPTEAMSFPHILAGLHGEGPVARGPALYATRLHAIAAIAVAPVVMLVLALPSAFGLPRQPGGFRRSAIGLALGLLYLVVAGLLGALAEAAAIAPALAAWTPVILFGTVATMLVWREQA